ncbi:hypothetical protein CKO15_04955 [Halorhodospira abdelmalekii]|nr:hypothetical protein [Halorhodospira abdelmalekii]
MTFDSFDHDSGVIELTGQNEASIESEQLRENLTVQFQTEEEDPLTGMVVHWRAARGVLEIIAYDPSEEYAPVYYRGDPALDGEGSSQIQRMDTGSATVEPQAVFVTAALLTFTAVTVGAAQIDYAINTYRMERVRLENYAIVSDRSTIIKASISDVMDFVDASYQAQGAIVKVGIGMATGSPSFASFALGATGSNAVDVVVDAISEHNQERVYSDSGAVTGDTRVWASVEGWDTRSPFDVTITVFPVGYEDHYEPNDSLDEAVRLRSRSEGPLFVGDNNPDYYRVYLNEGNAWDAKIRFNHARSNLNLTLYGPDGEELDHSNRSDRDDGSEYVSIESAAEPGWYAVGVEKDGGDWSSAAYNLEAASVGGTPGSTDGADEYRFVLEWGQDPRDLDAHLLTPRIDEPPVVGEEHHLYFGTRRTYDLSSPPYIHLDTDEVSGFGPETITIGQLYDGTYTYSVHKFAGSGTLAGSGASVSVYDRHGLIRDVTIDDDGSADRWWHVFEIDGEDRRLRLVDEISNTHITDR